MSTSSKNRNTQQHGGGITCLGEVSIPYRQDHEKQKKSKSVRCINNALTSMKNVSQNVS